MTHKAQKVTELEQLVESLQQDLDDLTRDYNKKCLQLYEKDPPKEKPRYGGSIAFDFWPLRDWFRFNRSPWSANHYFQVQLGPFRFEFFE